MVAWLVSQRTELLNYSYALSLERWSWQRCTVETHYKIKQRDCEVQALYPVIVPPTRGKSYKSFPWCSTGPWQFHCTVSSEGLCSLVRWVGIFTVGDWLESTQSDELAVTPIPPLAQQWGGFVVSLGKRGEGELPSATNSSGTMLWGFSTFCFQHWRCQEALMFFWSSRLVVLICFSGCWVSGQHFVPYMWEGDRSVGAEMREQNQAAEELTLGWRDTAG